MHINVFIFNRYIAVCFPFFRLRHNLKARYYIIPILLFAPLYNLPRFFEFETVKEVSFTCLDDQLDALNRNRSSLNTVTNAKYNISFLPQNFLEGDNFNSTSIHSTKLQKREVNDHLDLKEPFFHGLSSIKQTIDEHQIEYIAQSRTKLEEDYDIRLKRSIENEHINNV